MGKGGAVMKNPYIEERYEIIEGIRYDLKPAPTVTHQRLLGALHIMMYQTCHTNGVILFSPLDVHLDEDNQFQPDLVFILHQNASIIKEKRIEGAPDLVAEVLSPSTSHNDKIRKKRQYERHEVKEYWLIDPVHRTVDQFILEQQKFVLFETYGITGRLTSPQFSCIEIDMSQLFVSSPS
jgi:Uma2 family endonuclease